MDTFVPGTFLGCGAWVICISCAVIGLVPRLRLEALHGTLWRLQALAEKIGEETGVARFLLICACVMSHSLVGVELSPHDCEVYLAAGADGSIGLPAKEVVLKKVCSSNAVLTRVSAGSVKLHCLNPQNSGVFLVLKNCESNEAESLRRSLSDACVFVSESQSSRNRFGLMGRRSRRKEFRKDGYVISVRFICTTAVGSYVLSRLLINNS